MSDVTALAVTTDLGQDADLLLESDQRLKNRYNDIASQMSRLAAELRTVMLAQHIKVHLQNQNKVAVRSTEYDQDGRVLGMHLHLLPLPDAIVLASQQREDDARNQLMTWHKDGYDIEAGARLRQLL